MSRERASGRLPAAAKQAKASGSRRPKKPDTPTLARDAGNAAMAEVVSTRDARLHTGPVAAAAAAAFHARALTVGRDVWFGAGESISDQALLAHELTHVAQQAVGGERNAVAGVAPIIRSEVHETEARSTASTPLGAASIVGPVTAAPLGVQCDPKPGVELPPTVKLVAAESGPDGRVFSVLVEGVIVADVLMPKGMTELPAIETEFDDANAFVPAEAQVPRRLVRVWIERRKGVGMRWRLDASEGLKSRGFIFEQALGPLRRVPVVASKPATKTPTAKTAAPPRAATTAPPKPAVSRDEQDLLDEIDAYERYARKPNLTAAELSAAFAGQRRLMKRLSEIRHGSSQPPPAPKPDVPRDPLLRRGSIDPDTLTGRELGEEVMDTRRWLAAQIQSNAEVEDVRKRLQPLERALEARSKSLQDAHRRINEMVKSQGGVLLDPKQMGMSAGYAFALAFLGAAELELRPVEFERLKNELIGGSALFSAGATAGLVEGALEGLWDNIAGLAELIFKMSIFAQIGRAAAEVQAWWTDSTKYFAEKAKAWADAKETLSALYGLVEQLVKEPMFLTLHAEELGKIAGEHAADWFNDAFMRMDVFDKGELLGKVAGRVLLEIALLFLGPEEWIARGAVAAGQAMRISPKLAKAVMLAMEKIPALARLMKLRPEANALREAVIAGKDLKAGAEALEGAKDAAALRDASKGVESIQEARDAAKGGALPDNVRQLPPPKRPVELPKSAEEVDRAVAEGKATRITDSKAPPSEPAAASKTAVVEDVPAETEGALALKRQGSDTAGVSDTADQVTSMAGKRGGGKAGPPPRAPTPSKTTTTRGPSGPSGPSRAGGTGGGPSGGVPGKMPRPTPIKVIDAPPGRLGPLGKAINQKYPPQAWHDVADLESRFPKLRGKGTRPVYRGSGVGKLDERVTTTGTSYSFQIELEKVGAGEAKAVELDGITADGVVLDNKQLSSIERRWQNELETLEERHGPTTTFEHMSGSDEARRTAARQRFNDRIEREVEDMGDQLSRQSQAIKENGLKGGEWTVPDEAWKEKLDAQLVSRGIKNIKVIVR